LLLVSAAVSAILMGGGLVVDAVTVLTAVVGNVDFVAAAAAGDSNGVEPEGVGPVAATGLERISMGDVDSAEELAERTLQMKTKV
jgi:hypothetical protein